LSNNVILHFIPALNLSLGLNTAMKFRGFTVHTLSTEGLQIYRKKNAIGHCHFAISVVFFHNLVSGNRFSKWTINWV